MSSPKQDWLGLVRWESYAAVAYSLLCLLVHFVWPSFFDWESVFWGAGSVFVGATFWCALGYLLMLSYEKTERDFRKKLDEINPDLDAQIAAREAGWREGQLSDPRTIDERFAFEREWDRRYEERRPKDD